jgi:hypothetical protein
MINLITNAFNSCRRRHRATNHQSKRDEQKWVTIASTTPAPASDQDPPHIFELPSR